MRFLVLTSVLLAACAAVTESTSSDAARLTFVHLNDTYRVGAVEDGAKGGFGRVVTVIRQLQDEGRDVRILHGGDFLYPSLESQIWNGEQMVDAFNYMDAIAPMYLVAGNHDLDRRTPEHLINAVKAADFDWLGDNYRLKTGDSEVDAALRSTFTYEHAGKTVGIFSLTLHFEDGGNNRDYVDVDRNYVEVAERVIEHFESQGVDVMIGLTHLHKATDLELARLKSKHRKLAFIAGGHEHEPNYDPPSARSAAVIKGASNARVIWQIDVTFDEAGAPVVDAQQLEMNESIEEDSAYARINLHWRGRLLDMYPFLESGIGKTAFPLDATEETIRNSETSWGNFIADQMRRAFGEPLADLAFINSGTLRIDDYIAEDIQFEDIARTFGFSSYLRYMNISGAEFRRLIEAGYRGEGSSKGYFPQVSGFRVCVDKNRPSLGRIVSLQVPTDEGWQDIEADQEYLLVIPDFLYRGGDGYVVPEHRKRSASRPGSELKYLVFDAIVRAQAEGHAIGEPVDPANPRYVEIGPDRSTCWQ